MVGSICAHHHGGALASLCGRVPAGQSGSNHRAIWSHRAAYHEGPEHHLAAVGRSQSVGGPFARGLCRFAGQSAASSPECDTLGPTKARQCLSVQLGGAQIGHQSSK